MESGFVLRLAFLLFWTRYHQITCKSEEENSAKVGRINGDFIIGALFPIHEQTPTDSSSTCGPIREQYGMQRVEAALWTVKRINDEKSILPNITLGIEIRDSCWNTTLALDRALQFVHSFRRASDNEQCTATQRVPDTTTSTEKISPIIGVIGPASSEEVVLVQTLLKIFRIPEIGYSATSADLSDKRMFGYFVRVVPSDRFQANVILHILQKYNWTYVNVVNTEGVYGSSGLKEFKTLADQNNICIAYQFSLHENEEPNEIEDRIQKMRKEHPTARVIICFCQGNTVSQLLNATKFLNMSRHFLFIGTDGWAGRHEIVKDLEAEAEGSIVIQIYSHDVGGFSEFYFKLKERLGRPENPWINEFWEIRFNCSNRDHPSLRRCSGNESLSQNYTEDPKLSFIVKSVYSFAYALRNYRAAVCGENATYCPQLRNFNTTVFLDFVRNVSFPYNNATVQFDNDGDPIARYDILNYQKLDNQSYSYVRVGNWTNYTMHLNSSIIRLPNNIPSISSVCRDPCKFGEYKSYNLSNKTCCWTCMSCSQSQYSDREKCMNCSEFEILNLNRDGCDRMRETYFQWNRREAIICLMFAIFGILLSVSTAAVFYKYGDTPIIKSSDKELSCTMFVGMIFLHMFVFVVLGKPTEIQCTLERIIPGVSLTIMYSALVVKTNRISRILSLSKRRFPKIKPKFLSLKFQVLVCSLFIISEAFICTMHLYIRPSHVERTPASSKDTVFLRCNEQLDGFMVDHLLNIVLLVLCTSYAFKTRNLPDNFNEAKFIGFSCYATSITWLAFVVVFHTSIYKLSSLCIALSMTALINLTFLFFPKMYIIFWKPQRNSREYFKTTNDIRCYIGSATVTHDYQLLMRNVIRGDFLSNTSITDRDINIKLQAYDARISVLNGSDNNNRTRTISCQTCPDDLH